MANQVFYSNRGDNAQWDSSNKELYLKNMHSFSSLRPPPPLQYMQDCIGIRPDYENFIKQGKLEQVSHYQPRVMSMPSTPLPQFEVGAGQPNLIGHSFQAESIYPMRDRGIAPAIDNTLHYYQNSANPSAYNIQPSNQHWTVPPNPNQEVYLTQASASHIPKSHINLPSSQTMANGAQGSKAVYSPTYKSTSQVTNKTPRQTTVGAVAAEIDDAAELEAFAQSAKRRRITLGLTQENIGNGLGVLHNRGLSQTTICRFEAGQLSISNMRKLKPILSDLFDRLETNEESREIVNRKEYSQSTGNRKRRTSFSADSRQVLVDSFMTTTHPSTYDIQELARSIDQDCHVVRVWFCNQRQKHKRGKNKMAEEAASIPPTVNENCAMTPMAALQPLRPHVPNMNGSNVMCMPAYSNE